MGIYIISIVCNFLYMKYTYTTQKTVYKFIWLDCTLYQVIGIEGGQFRQTNKTKYIMWRHREAMAFQTIRKSTLC